MTPASITQPKRDWRGVLSGLVWMSVGSIAVLSTVVLMNELSEMPAKKQIARSVEMEVQRAPKPPPKQEVEQPRPRPKQSPKAPPPPSLAALGSGLAGIAFDLPALQFQYDGAEAANLLTSQKDVVHTSETVDTPPRPIEQQPMRFPKELQDRGVEGYVVLSILISPSGGIDQVKVIESKPAGEFDQAALEGIRSWRFSPATYKGEPVSLWIRQKIRFELSGR